MANPKQLLQHHTLNTSQSTSRSRSVSRSAANVSVAPPLINQSVNTGHTSHHKIVVVPGFTCEAWTSEGVTQPIPTTTFGSGASSRNWWRILALLNFAAWPLVLLHRLYTILSRAILWPWKWAMQAFGVKRCVPNLSHGFDQFVLVS